MSYELRERDEERAVSARERERVLSNTAGSIRQEKYEDCLKAEESCCDAQTRESPQEVLEGHWPWQVLQRGNARFALV